MDGRLPLCSTSGGHSAVPPQLSSTREASVKSPQAYVRSIVCWGCSPRALSTRHFANLHPETAQRIFEVLVSTFDVPDAFDRGLSLRQESSNEVGKTSPQIRHSDVRPTQVHRAFDYTAMPVVGGMETARCSARPGAIRGIMAAILFNFWNE